MFENRYHEMDYVMNLQTKHKYIHQRNPRLSYGDQWRKVTMTITSPKKDTQIYAGYFSDFT